MVHEQTLSTTLVEVGAGLPEKRIHTELEVEFLVPQLGHVLGEGRSRAVGLALLGLGAVSTFSVLVVFVVVISTDASFVRQVTEEFSGLCANAVYTTGPDLDTAVQCAGGTLEVDRVVGVVSQ